MTALSIILDIVLILISLVLIAVVLMQQGQRQGLGAISGGAETFFGKGKAKGLDAKLAKITKVSAVAFIVLAIATTIVVSHNTPRTTSAADLSAPLQDVVDDAAATEAPADAATEAPVEATEAPADAATEAPAETADAE